MQFIDFRDTCEIWRETGKDEWDNATYDPVYSGSCLYEEGGQAYASRIINRNPLVFLPLINDPLVMMNDRVIVTTNTGRVIDGLIRVVRDIKLDKMNNVNMTRIELKQATGE